MYISKYPLYFKQYIDYEALKQCLSIINEEFKGKKILTTIVGSTKFDGLGERDKCLEILNEYTNNLDIDVYDYPITSTEYIFKKLRQYFNKVKQKHKINAEKKRIIDQLKKDVIKGLYLKDSEKG